MDAKTSREILLLCQEYNTSPDDPIFQFFDVYGKLLTKLQLAILDLKLIENRTIKAHKASVAIEQEIREISIQKQEKLYQVAKEAENFITEQMQNKMDVKFKQIDSHVNRLLDSIKQNQRESYELRSEKDSAYKKLENLFNSFSKYQKMANKKLIFAFITVVSISVLQIATMYLLYISRGE